MQFTALGGSNLGAIQHSEFTWRYLAGVVKDSKLPKEKVKKFQWLVKNGFARSSSGKGGPIWSLTEEGRTAMYLTTLSHNK